MFCCIITVYACLCYTVTKTPTSDLRGGVTGKRGYIRLCWEIIVAGCHGGKVWRPNTMGGEAKTNVALCPRNGNHLRVDIKLKSGVKFISHQRVPRPHVRNSSQVLQILAPVFQS